MNKYFQRRVAKALRLRREELIQQVTVITKLLDEWDPARPKLAPRTADEQTEDRILSVADRQWKTDLQLGVKAGITSKLTVHKTLRRLVDSGRMEQTNLGGYTHYRRVHEELRLVAGVGELR